ncbi:hypothetical protein [Bacillus sp. 2205SS5-2]
MYTKRAIGEEPKMMTIYKMWIMSTKQPLSLFIKIEQNDIPQNS